MVLSIHPALNKPLRYTLSHFLSRSVCEGFVFLVFAAARRAVVHLPAVFAWRSWTGRGGHCRAEWYVWRFGYRVHVLENSGLGATLGCFGSGKESVSPWLFLYLSNCFACLPEPQHLFSPCRWSASQDAASDSCKHPSPNRMGCSILIQGLEQCQFVE